MQPSFWELYNIFKNTYLVEYLNTAAYVCKYNNRNFIQRETICIFLQNISFIDMHFINCF